MARMQYCHFPVSKYMLNNNITSPLTCSFTKQNKNIKIYKDIKKYTKPHYWFGLPWTSKQAFHEASPLGVEAMQVQVPVSPSWRRRGVDILLYGNYLNVCHSFLNQQQFLSLSPSSYLSPTITALLIDILVKAVAGSCHCLIISVSSLSQQKLGESSWKGQVADHFQSNGKDFHRIID